MSEVYELAKVRQLYKRARRFPNNPGTAHRELMNAIVALGALRSRADIPRDQFISLELEILRYEAEILEKLDPDGENVRLKSCLNQIQKLEEELETLKG